MNGTEQATSRDLLTLVDRAAPGITAPPDLAGQVLAQLSPQPGSRRGRWVVVAIGGLAAAGALAAAALPGRGDYFSWTQPSHAMAPTVAVGQDVVLSKASAPERGDVVLLRVHDATGDYDSLSRVIGLPGDTVSCPRNEVGTCDAVVVSGQPLREPWITEPTSPFATVHVPAGHVFVLGDSRSGANDSRFIGPQPLDDVRGVAVARITEDGVRERLPGTPERPLPGGGTPIDPPDPVPPAGSA